MKTAICLAGIALFGCGGMPDDSPPEQQEPTQQQDIGAVGQSPAPGVWADKTACSGSALTGRWISDFGFDPPALLGGTPSGCRPAAGKYALQCWQGGDMIVPAGCQKASDGTWVCNTGSVSTGILSCVVTVDAAGNVTLNSPAPMYGMTVYAKFQ